jgi:chromosome segregation ATPase
MLSKSGVNASTTASTAQGTESSNADETTGPVSAGQALINAYGLATALDTPLAHPMLEAKFQTLRLHSATKIRSLLGTIDAQVKKLKALKDTTDASIDSRTATIHALKKKLRDQEYIADVLKEQLVSLLSISREEINSRIIGETITGPKRYRQLTREEVENQLAALEAEEKRLKETTKTVVVTASLDLRASNKSDTRGVSFSNYHSSAYNETSTSSTSGNGMTMAGVAEGDETAQGLLSERSRLDDMLRDQDDRIASLNADIEKARVRYLDAMIADAEVAASRSDASDTLSAHQRTEESLSATLAKLSQVRDALRSVRAKASSDRDIGMAEVARVEGTARAAIAENGILLRKMRSIEERLQKAIEDPGSINMHTYSDGVGESKESVYISISKHSGSSGGGGSPHKSTSQSSSVSEDGSLIDLEARLEQQLRDSESQRSLLSVKAAECNVLRDQLRDKNEELRELKRRMAEIARTRIEAK